MCFLLKFLAYLGYEIIPCTDGGSERYTLKYTWLEYVEYHLHFDTQEELMGYLKRSYPEQYAKFETYAQNASA
jgi:hypothetical protein